MAKATKSERGKKVAKSREENAKIRARIGDMNSTQLRHFFLRFDGGTFGRIEAAVARVHKDRLSDEITQRQKEIERIQAEVAQLQEQI